MPMGHGYGSFWTMAIMIVFWLGLTSLGIILIVNFIRGDRKRSPIDILQERLAKGDISIDDYERLKSRIEQER